MLRWLWLSLLVLVLDQLSKQLVEASFGLHQVMALAPGFNLTLAYNEGAAFSFLSDQGGWQRWLFVGLASLVSLVLVIWISRLQRHDRLLAISLSLVLGGALGNLLDRVLFGHVIDFIDIYYGDWHWPAFNLADSAITLGVVLLLLDAFFERDDQPG